MKNGRKKMNEYKECDQCLIEMPVVDELEKALENGIEGGVFTDVDAEGNEDVICIFCEDWASGTDNIFAYVKKWGVEEFDKSKFYFVNFLILSCKVFKNVYLIQNTRNSKHSRTLTSRV
jgi:thiol-disulfide isomerase/thioredoxin